jgi:hypothetical protein
MIKTRLDVKIIQVHRPIHIYVGILYCIVIDKRDKANTNISFRCTVITMAP